MTESQVQNAKKNGNKVYFGHAKGYRASYWCLREWTCSWDIVVVIVLIAGVCEYVLVLRVYLDPPSTLK